MNLRSIDVSARAASATAALLVVLAAPGIARAQATPPDYVDRIVAVVNDEVITSFELEKVCELRREFRQLKQQNPTDPQLDLIRLRSLKLLVDERLLTQLVVEEKIEWTDADDEQLEQALLKEAKPHGSIEALDAALRKLDIDPEFLRERLKTEITLSKLFLRKIRADIFIRPEDMRKYYEENPGEFFRAARVVVRQLYLSKGNNPADARLRIEQARSRIVAGEDFEEVAREISEGPKRDDGGLWPFEGTHRVEMIPPIGEIANGLPVGELSEVIDTRRGWAVIRVEERQRREVKTFEQVQDEIQSTLQRREWDRRLDKWMSELRRRAFIREFLK